ncbi:MAG TPA: hypothetical protein VGF97_17005 [Rhizomicrobium sp.]|jgi:hypothetical protein
MIWLWLALAAAGFGFVLLVAGLGHLLGGRPLRASGHLASGAPLAVFGCAAALLGVNVQSFARLTHEGPVALVSVRSLDPKASLYVVTVERLDAPVRQQTCVLQGDEWVLSGRVQKWKPWANMLGLDATYTLDQISNMYFTAARGNGQRITACDIAGRPPDVDRYVPPQWLDWLAAQSYSVERRFGSANYMPLADGAIYRVLITQSGFNAEPVNDIARTANARRP